MERSRWFYIRETLVNLFLVAYFGRQAYVFYLDFMETGRYSSVIFILFVSVLALMSLVRHYPKDVSFSLRDWSVAILGTLMHVLVMPAEGATAPLVGEIIQSAGLLVTVLGVLSLNRSYGTVPANRGIKTTGMYALVRHPLYMGYILSDIGILLSQFSYWNLGVVIIAGLMLVLRIRFEEAFLRQDPEYLAFCDKTRFRLLPGIW